MRRSSPGRYEWMDLIRGLAVLCVVTFHAAAIPAMLGVEVPTAIMWMNNLLLPFRMPALLVLSGLLLARSMSKGISRYYSGKVANILWPYAVWLVILAFAMATPELLTRGSAWGGGTYLWFLLVIGCCYLIGPLTSLLPAPLVMLGLLVLSQVATDPWWVRMGYFGAFFFAGAWLGRVLPSLHLVTRRGRRLAAVIGVGWALVSTIWGIYPHNTVHGFGLSFIGVLAAILYTSRLGSSAPTRALQWVGRNSVVFYVAHFPVVIIAGTVLGRPAPGSTMGYLLIGLAAALLVSALLAVFRDSKWVSWLFTMPGIDGLLTASVEEEASVRRARRALRRRSLRPRNLGHTLLSRMIVLDGGLDDEQQPSADRPARAGRDRAAA